MTSVAAIATLTPPLSYLASFLDSNSFGGDDEKDEEYRQDCGAFSRAGLLDVSNESHEYDGTMKHVSHIRRRRDPTRKWQARISV